MDFLLEDYTFGVVPLYDPDGEPIGKQFNFKDASGITVRIKMVDESTIILAQEATMHAGELDARNAAAANGGTG